MYICNSVLACTSACLVVVEEEYYCGQLTVAKFNKDKKKDIKRERNT